MYFVMQFSYLCKVIVDIMAILFCGKYLEPIWGSKEFIRFLFVVNACCGISTFVWMIFLYYLSGNLNLW